MQIYIDESGSFVSTPNPGSWSVVAAIVTAESSRKALEKNIKALKRSVSAPNTSEVKLKDIPETHYFSFLDGLSKAQVLLFATATDSGHNTLIRIERHRKQLVQNIYDQVPLMHHEDGRIALQTLVEQLNKVSPQLYVQLLCQVDLFHDIVNRSINYFAQHLPGTLSKFRWHIDQKNTSKTIYENAFEKIAPVLIQTRSIKEPGARISGLDYRKMKNYEFKDNQLPDFLDIEHKILIKDAINIEKIIRDNLKFEDSRSSLGIQVADLVASGLRRCLRAEFKDNHAAAVYLGKLMLKNKTGENPINIISFAENSSEIDKEASAVVNEMKKHCRPMIKNI